MSVYTLGKSRSQPYARFETKAGHGSGAGYERHRSYEFRPHTARKSKEDVYVPHHRLLYLLHPDMLELPLEEAIQLLDGCDVHHRNGVKWDNRLYRREAEDEDGGPESNLELLEHGTHSQITQAEMRAWAEDDRRRLDGDLENDGDRCDRCGEEADLLGTSAAFEGERCLECAQETAGGEAIEL